MADLENKLIALLTMIALLLFSGSYGEQTGPDYEGYADEIIDVFVREMEAEGFYCNGTGGSMPHEVEKIIVWFVTCQHPSLSEARDLELHAVNRLAELVNGHEKIRPFLTEFPFGLDRLQVAISFRQPNAELHADGSVTRVSSIKGKFYYDAYDQQAEDIYQIASETIQAAIEKQKAGATSF
jgi:hypothetical protein